MLFPCQPVQYLLVAPATVQPQVLHALLARLVRHALDTQPLSSSACQLATEEEKLLQVYGDKVLPAGLDAGGQLLQQLAAKLDELQAGQQGEVDSFKERCKVSGCFDC